MSLNSISLSGNAGKPSYRPAGQETKGGKIMKFSSLAFPIRIPDDKIIIGGKDRILAQQSLWVEVGIPKHDGKDDDRKINALLDRIARGEHFVRLIDAKLTSWGQPPRYQLKVGWWDLQLYQTSVQPFNRATVSGKVLRQDSNSLFVEERYQAGKGDWKTREIPVFLTSPLPPVQDKVVLVYGRLATGDNQTAYIIAEEVY